ncbi:MAG: DUF4404 family protein [Gammaproteobacteria bacterium]|nr:DUF4404 family protein [Gammaproteobacteria bacterium]MDP2141922.1 DUF4404 family protein [Gammaproteobacteria bacterium]MDP2347196.1 DUF4404 family protein [Gammaproteobacteria bacterium]
MGGISCCVAILRLQICFALAQSIRIGSDYRRNTTTVEMRFILSLNSIGIGREYLSENIKNLLNQLQKALAETEQVDDETLEMVKKLDNDIETFIASAEDVNSPVLDDAIALEARFAANHPVAERIIRELIDSLGRIGI